MRDGVACLRKRARDDHVLLLRNKPTDHEVFLLGKGGGVERRTTVPRNGDEDGKEEGDWGKGGD